jgi:hypothetical protein
VSVHIDNKNVEKPNFLLTSSRSLIAGSGSAFGSGSISQRYGSVDPDLHQNIMDPQHCRRIYNTCCVVTCRPARARASTCFVASVCGGAARSSWERTSAGWSASTRHVCRRRAVFRISGIRCLFLTPGSGMGKISRSGPGMNIPDHISKSLETVFWVKDT